MPAELRMVQEAESPVAAAASTTALTQAPPVVTALPYSSIVARKPRWRTLPVPVSITAIICGTLLIGTGSISMASNGSSGVPDYVAAICWAAGACGLGIALLGILLAAPRRRNSDSR